MRPSTETSMTATPRLTETSISIQHILERDKIRLPLLYLQRLFANCVTVHDTLYSIFYTGIATQDTLEEFLKTLNLKLNPTLDGLVTELSNCLAKAIAIYTGSYQEQLRLRIDFVAAIARSIVDRQTRNCTKKEIVNNKLVETNEIHKFKTDLYDYALQIVSFRTAILQSIEIVLSCYIELPPCEIESTVERYIELAYALLDNQDWQALDRVAAILEPQQVPQQASACPCIILPCKREK
jgi:hypothetical protein